MDAKHTERGSILLLTALSMVVLLGMLALVIDASFMYTERNRLSAAADAAAKSAAWELWRGGGSNIQAYANREVVAHGFAPNPGGDTDVTVTIPPDDGLHAGESGYAEVTVSRTTSTFFGTVLGFANLRPAARAVAGTSNGPNCIVTLAPPGYSPSSLNLGNTTLTMPNCSVSVGGNLEGTNPNADINASGITAAAASCTGSYCGNFENVRWTSPPPYDQFDGKVPAIPSLGGCAPAPSSGNIGGGGTCYSSLNAGTNNTITLLAGTTYFTGPVTFGNNSTLRGTGVTLVLADGASITTGNNTDIILTAPTSGAYSGVAIYQPKTNSRAADFQNSPLFNVNGAVYMPASDVSFRNGLRSTSDCVLIVVHSLSINNGNGSLNNACSAFSGSPLLTISIAE
jgi:hypothetical protein